MHAKHRDALIAHKAEHTDKAITARLDAGSDPSYLRDLVFGAVDGTVTTFAVVSGVAGAGLSTGILIVLGLANLVADGFSMATSNFLATRADADLLALARSKEGHHVRVYPEGEREEIRQIFMRKGFSGPDLDRAVDVITSDMERWVDTMVTEELGMRLEGPNPWKAAVSTFAAFSIVGMLPLATFVCDALFPGSIAHPFVWSGFLTGCAFLGVGALKGRFVRKSWYGSSLETFLLGGVAALLAYSVGVLLRNFAGM